VPLITEGIYCAGCGYDLRGLSSDRCPECGLTIQATHEGVIPWERRKRIGYFSSFFLTLLAATFSPIQFARATNGPIDVRSAKLFRWIMRTSVVAPVEALLFYLSLNHVPNPLIVVMGVGQRSQALHWEARFVWTVGARFWATLPVGFAISVILATGASHWLFMKRLEPQRQNRVMALGLYLFSPMGWIWIPFVAFTASMIVSDAQFVTASAEALASNLRIAGGLTFLAIVPAIVDAVRAVNAATQCGFIRSWAMGAGVILQAVASFTLGLLLLPMVVGLFRLMVDSLWR
jgi:hypothetical protein